MPTSKIKTLFKFENLSNFMMCRIAIKLGNTAALGRQSLKYIYMYIIKRKTLGVTMNEKICIYIFQSWYIFERYYFKKYFISKVYPNYELTNTPIVVSAFT